MNTQRTTATTAPACNAVISENCFRLVAKAREDGNSGLLAIGGHNFTYEELCDLKQQARKENSVAFCQYVRRLNIELAAAKLLYDILA